MDVLDESSLGGLLLKNRFIMAPVKTSMGLPGGTVTDDNIRFYAKIATGGTAAIILEPMAVLPNGKEHPKQLSIHHDSFIPGIRKMVDAIHQNGALAGIHLNHAGRAANPKVINQFPLAPSKMICPATGAEAQEITSEQIHEIVEAFGKAVKRAVATGADFIEIQFGHGYLVSQFCSARTNTRTDEYGGDRNKRMRFAREVLKQVNEKKEHLPIFVRISGKEFVDGGLSENDLQPMLELIESHGVSAVHVGYGNACDNPPWYYNHMAMPEEEQYKILQTVRDKTRLPIIAVGRMGYIPKINKVLDENLADYIALGRPLLADPEFPVKLASGREEEIILCGGCLEGCLRSVKKGEKITCIVNPDFTMPDISPDGESKKVMIAGGGMAGISAALHLARRGHRVSLFEKSRHLGGQADFAPAAECLKKQLRRTVDSVKKQLNTIDVDVIYNSEVTPDLVRRENPDVLIVATGSRQNIPPIENLESQDYFTSLEFFGDPGKLKGDRVLVIGLGMIGLEAAAILANQQKEVIGVEPLKAPAENMEPIARKLLLNKLSQMDNIKLFTNTFVRKFTDEGVVIEENGQEKVLPPVDSVIVAAGMRPFAELADGLTECCNGEIYVIGDAHEVGDIKSAFSDGANVMTKI